MSLINQMLQDLEKRQVRKGEDTKSNFAEGLNPVPEYKTKRGFLSKRRTIYLGIFVLFLLIVLLLRMGKKEPETLAVPSVVPVAAPASIPAASSDSAAQPGENPYLTLSKQVGGLVDQTKTVAQTANTAIQQTENKIEGVQPSDSSAQAAPTTSANTNADVDDQPAVAVQDGGETDISVEAEIGPMQPSMALTHADLMKITVSPVSDSKQTATFYIDAPFKYEFTEKSDKNQINVMFFNITTDGDILPTLEAISYITEINFVRQEENATFTITLGKDVAVSGLTTDKSDSPQKLILTLNGPEIQPSITTGETSSGKKISEMSKVVKPPTPQEQLQLDYESALNDLKQNKMESATKKLEAILEANPAHLTTRSDLMTLHLERRNYDELQRLLNEALLISPQFPPFVMMQARLLMLEKKNNEALLIMNTISPNIQEYPDFYAILGTLEQQAGNYQLAAQIYLELIRVESYEGRWWLGYGLALEALEKRNIALQAYEKAIATGSLSIDLEAFTRGRVDALGG